MSSARKISLALSKAASLGALIFVAFPFAGNAAAPVPGQRFLDDSSFASKSATEQRWCHKAVESGAKAIVPAFSTAESIVVYSLDPSNLELIQPGVTDRRHFHGFPILGRATVWRSEDLEQWRRIFIEGLTPCERVLCFAPRHGIRIQTRTATVDLVLCFECSKMRVFGAGPDLATDDCFFDAAVLDLLNAFLDGHRIKRDLPKP